MLLEILCGVMTPLAILLGGAVLSRGIRLHSILQPRRFAAALLDTPRDAGTTPFMSLTMALAGTLGVGNITGVACAITSGGAGAVFWMWAGAVLSMAIKYGEVALAVKYRRHEKGRFFGGAMYYMSDGLARRFPGRSFLWLGGAFAILCMANALVTGTVVQANAAADVVRELPQKSTGAILAALTAASALFGIHRIGKITERLIPVLAGVYMLLSLAIILGNIRLLPDVFGDIFRSAFSFRSAAGGALGITAREAVRFGITRGIFSNEAGCGTSPTAHASADTKSPFHQGCCGIFEVAADTLILCTMTALVLLIGERNHGILSHAAGEGGAALTIDAFALGAGSWVRGILAASVVLFAYATIVAQLYYGYTALAFLTKSRLLRAAYLAATLAAAFAGAVINPDAMWTLADTVVCLMTLTNTAVLLILRRDIYATVEEKGKNGEI